VVFRGDVEPDGSPSRRSLSEGPPSGPVSGIVAPILFRGAAGPGYWIRDEGEPSVKVAFTDLDLAPCRVLRMSPTGILFAPDRGVSYPLDEPVQVSLSILDRELAPLWGRIVGPTSPVENQILGVSFKDIPYGPARQSLIALRELTARGLARLAHRPPQVRETVSESTRVRSIVKALAAVGNEGRIETIDGALLVKIAAVAENGTLQWDGPSGWGEGPYYVDFVGYNSVFRMCFTQAVVAGDRVETPMPASIERVRYRANRRAEAQQRLEVSLYHPLWPRLPQICKEVRDISFGGLSFAMTLDTDMLFPGLTIPTMEIRSEKGDLVRLRGEVRAISVVNGEEIAGLSVEPFSSRDELRWHRLIADMLHAHTRTSENLLQPLWNLFEDSGYFKLAGRTSEYFADLQRNFIDMGRRSADAPQLVCQVVWPSDRGVEATGSFLKAYEHSWMGHQLARRPGRPHGEAADSGQILRDVYARMFEHSQSDPDLRWVFGAIEPHVKWMQQAHLDFAHKYESAERALVMEMRMLNAFVADQSAVPIGDYTVAPATDAEKQLLCSVIRRERPGVYAECLDFVEERIDCHKVSRQWMNAGMEREREILIARRGGQPVCAAVFETGQAGSNMFRLLDSARIIPLAPPGRSQVAYLRMLDEGRRWFAARGRDMYLYLREDNDWSYAEAGKLHDVSDARFWCISAELIPEFLEHVYELTGQRAPKQ
jgi:hypothetical protein